MEEKVPMRQEEGARVVTKTEPKLLSTLKKKRREGTILISRISLLFLLSLFPPLPPGLTKEGRRRTKREKCSSNPWLKVVDVFKSISL